MPKQKKEPTLIWKGKTLRTYRDIMDDGIGACETPEEAQAFMGVYRAYDPHADANVGYLSGYYGATEAQRIREWFGVEHPIFGSHRPTTQEALLAGAALAAGQRGERVVKAAFRPEG